MVEHPTLTRVTVVGLAGIALMGVLLGTAPATAQLGVPLRVEGYWDRSEDDDPELLGELTLARHTARTTRMFGVAHVQTHFGADQGMHVFTDTMRPVFNVNGPRDMVDRFFGAPPNRPVILLAIFDPRRGSLMLTSLEIEGPDR